MAECVECGAQLNVDEKTEVGEIIACPECGVELEVTGINPVKVDAAPQEEEDWGE